MADRMLVLEQKLELWENTEIDARLDGQVATAIGNEGMVKQSAKRLKEAIQAVAFLTKLRDQWREEPTDDREPSV